MLPPSSDDDMGMEIKEEPCEDTADEEMSQMYNMDTELSSDEYQIGSHSDFHTTNSLHMETTVDDTELAGDDDLYNTINTDCVETPQSTEHREETFCRMDIGTTTAVSSQIGAFQPICTPGPNMVPTSRKITNYLTELGLSKQGVLVLLLMTKKCPHCQLIVESCWKLIQHVKIKHKFDRLFQRCSVSGCNVKCHSAIAKFDHTLRKHSVSLEFSCLFCKKIFTDINQTRIHLGQCHIFGCYLCGEHFSTDPELQCHNREFHLFHLCFKCTICPNSTTTLYNFNAHVRSHFDITQYMCKICEVPCFFSGHPAVTRHIEECHPPSQPRGFLTCPDCPGYNTYSARHLSYHWKNGCKSFDCKNCGKKFFNRTPLSIHERTCGKPELLLTCDQCPYKVPTLSRLRRHIHSQHENHETFCNTCSMCSASRAAAADATNSEAQDVSRRLTIRYGRPMHAGKIVVAKKKSSVRMDQASVTVKDKGVNKSFCQFLGCQYIGEAVDLPNHVKITHKPAKKFKRDDGPFGLGRTVKYLCTLCGKVLRKIDSLTYHRIHLHNQPSNFQCEICSKYFSRPGKLMAHKVNTHKVTSGKSVNTKLHSCPLCDYVTPPGSFYRGLMRHLYTKHYVNGEKIPEGYELTLHKCTLCDYESNEERKVTRHMKLHARLGDALPAEYVAISVEGNDTTS